MTQCVRTPHAIAAALSPRAVRLGITLFLLGLLTGLAVPALANPRMALASHIEAVMNGTFLVALGLVWPSLTLRPRLLNAAFWFAVYGAFTNWVATLLAAVWRAGNPMMPLAAQGSVGSPAQELVLKALLVSLALAMIAASVLVLLGLRGPGAHQDDGQA
jgi:hydroxylaminobenzene mutase